MRNFYGLFGYLILGVASLSCGGDSTSPGGDGGGGDGGGGGSCPANTFCMTGSAFSPTARTVATGTTVRWTNESFTDHNVTWNDATGRNVALAGDGTGDIATFGSGTHTRLFNTPGTYGFHCTLHGSPTSGMRGTLTVQ
jgi:plastocyanin